MLIQGNPDDNTEIFPLLAYVGQTVSNGFQALSLGQSWIGIRNEQQETKLKNQTEQANMLQQISATVIVSTNGGKCFSLLN